MTYLEKGSRVIVALMTLITPLFTMMPATMWTVAAERIRQRQQEIKVTNVR